MKIKVLTFNLRTETTADGVNYFPNRKERILEAISGAAPDIIGFQEATDSMRAWLILSLSDYTVVGCGRGNNYRGEATIIAYRRGSFEMIKSETLWLSITPTIPGTGYGLDQSGCPRIMTAACLKHTECGEPFVFCNTHLDHKGKTARLLGSAQILQYLSSQPLKFILTGDFNATPASEEIKLLTSSQSYPVIDATAYLGGTFHGFGTRAEKSKIDYIFTNLPCDPAESFIVPDELGADGVYISDHHVVGAVVEI